MAVFTDFSDHYKVHVRTEGYLESLPNGRTYGIVKL